MKHRIDPKIDCVFKALLGSLENRNLLVSFLNAMLCDELSAPITRVEILNPYNDKEFLDDKLSIVDVKASDAQERIFQIEIQILGHAHLPARILYTWADIYSQQLQSGSDYRKLQPTYALWLLAENLMGGDDDYVHAFKMRDAKGRTLIEHGGIWLFELEKFSSRTIANEQQRWLLFFKHGGQLDEARLPEWMGTPEMRQAMTTLRQFSEKEINYHAYQARQNFLRQQRTLELDMEDAQREKAQALLREQIALEREQKALQREDEARQREHKALQEREAAFQERASALQEREAAFQEMASALREREAAFQEMASALQEREAALAEVARLKALHAG